LPGNVENKADNA